MELMATQHLQVKYSSLNNISVLNHHTAGEFVTEGAAQTHSFKTLEKGWVSKESCDSLSTSQEGFRYTYYCPWLQAQ